MGLRNRLSSEQYGRLQQSGADSAEAVFELAIRGKGPFNAMERSHLVDVAEPLVRDAAAVRNHRQPRLVMGVSGPPSASRALGDRATERRADGRQEDLARMVKRLEKAAPASCFVDDWASPMAMSADQGPLGSCTGFGSCAAADPGQRFPVLARGVGRSSRFQVESSRRFGYELGRRYDGQPAEAEGSWQESVFEGMVEIGSVSERLMPYTAKPGRLPIEHLFKAAAKRRLDGFVDLRPADAFMGLLPSLIRIVLAGLFPGLAQQPVAISLGVTEAWGYKVASDRGLILDLPDADALGGHALAVTGYYWDIDIEQTVFVMLNSWGGWASQNPVIKGCALVPESYLRRPSLVWEALTPVRGTSTISSLRWLGALARLGWRSKGW